ncbi:MAG: undecaprenyl/decaprenyl-phosphate alpha-N-acetylglucosaminyl 1-phosphate transferase [Nitrospiraceae bacterium]|nr:undecaprenyl/decaprenyl-phosphate alpha-N-acetylglucosaminyl 1-phosphate transferase [Nitrospiraceae bacterium]
MTSQIFFIFMTSLLLCMALIQPLRLLADRFHFMDQPGERKVHEFPIPKVGGMAFGLGAFASILWWVHKDSITLSLLLGGIIILGFGLWDDRVNLSYRIKLLGQILAALAVVIVGDIRFETIPFLPATELSLWIGIPVTVLFLVAASNAINLSDGLDGLAGGLSFLTLCGIGYLAYLSENTTVLLLTVPFLGGLLGFLRYNTYPARIFMGDSGSQLLGLTMGILAILLTDSSRGPYSPILSLFLLGLPFLDTLGVAGQRLAEGRSPFVGDRTHFHHKLMTAGLSHYEAVTTIYMIQGGMVGLAFLLQWRSDLLVLSIYLILACTVLALFIAAGKGLIAHSAPRAVLIRSNEWLSTILNGPLLCDVPIRFLAVVVPLFLIGSVFLPSYVSDDVSYISIALFGAVLFGLTILPRLAPYFVRGGLYIGSTFLLYASDATWMQAMAPIPMTYHVLFGALALMVLLCMRFDRQNRFQTTPLDYLMVCLAVIFPFLPEVSADISSLGLFAAKLIVLFLSFELLMQEFSNRMKQLGLVSLWVLLGLAIRGWL